jgi:2-polyprenyl-6-methoxyphenol hydroxylase-like FAD-dependent oxidoreductase
MSIETEFHIVLVWWVWMQMWWWSGSTGLTAAAELARRGWAVRVLDAAPAPFPGSRGKGLQPRSLEMLDPLEVTDRLVSLGRFRLPFRYHEPDGGAHDIDLHAGAEPTLERPWVRTLIIPQWRTEQVLRERLAELGVTVEQNAAVTDLAQHDDGLTLSITDGRRVQAGWVIGADGGSSTIRRLLEMPFLGETHEETRMLLADVEIDGLDRDHWHMWQNSDGAGVAGFDVALCPLPSTKTWQLAAQYENTARDGSTDQVRAAVAGLGPRIDVRRVHWSSIWRLNVRMVEHYRVGRVFLAGDAAHVHSPAGGQGMNTGIQDAVNLGWKLAAVLGGTDTCLLDTYEAERLPVAAGVLGLSSQLTNTAFWSPRSDPDHRTDQLNLTYRGGPLAQNGLDGPGPRPGDRGPDAPLRLPDGSPTSLFLLRREAEWTALSFGADPGKLPPNTQVLDAQALDIDGYLRRAYVASDGELVVLRPDGYIASRKQSDPLMV